MIHVITTTVKQINFRKGMKQMFTYLFFCVWLFNIDVDECSLGLDNCANNSQCINTNGSFLCRCNHGYSGNGVFCSGK
jgi:hypothetical protein